MAIYYVDAVDGNDSNSGLSRTLAWKTVAKVNASMASFAAGDEIRFRAGQTWRENLVISKSGTSGSPILFSFWNEGDLPRFDGADLLTGWTKTGGFTRVYQVACAWTPRAVWEDGSTVLQARATIADVDATPGGWFLSGGILYVSATDSSDPENSGRTYEAGRRDEVVTLSDVDWIRLVGLRVSHNNILSRGGISHLYTANRAGLDVHDCEIWDNWGRGLWLADPNASLPVYTYTSLSVLRNDVRRNGGSGIALSGGTGEVAYNTCVQNTAQEHEPWQAGIRLFGAPVTSLDCHHNTVRDQRNGYGGASQVGIHVDEVGSGVLVHHNTVDNVEHGGIFVENCTGVEVYRNQVTNAHAGIWTYRGCHEHKIYHNVVWGCRSPGIAIQGLDSADPNPAVKVGGRLVTNVKVYNNLAFNCNDALLKAVGGGENDGVNGIGNEYFNNAFGIEHALWGHFEWGEGVFYNTYAEWYPVAGASQEGTVEGDPRVVDADAHDFHLTALSPLVDAGRVIAGYNDDFEGLAPDIGLEEFTAPPMVIATNDLAAIGFTPYRRTLPRFGGERTRERVIPGRVGSLRVGAEYPSRTLLVQGALVAETHDELVEAFSALTAMVRGESLLRFSDYPEREWVGYLQPTERSTPMGPAWINRAEDLTLEWLLPDPRARSRNEITLQSGALAEPDWYQAVEIGDAPSPFRVTITAGATPITWIGIRTRKDTYTVLDSFEWSGVLAAGASVMLDTELQTFVDGGGVSRLSGMMPAAVFPQLDPAKAVDTVTVDTIGGTGAMIVLTYRKRWW